MSLAAAQSTVMNAMPINQLTALRNLKLEICASSDDSVTQSQLALADVFRFESANNLSSIVIEVKVQREELNPSTTYYEEFYRTCLVPGPSWLLLDVALAKPTLANLRKVVFNYDLVHIQTEWPLIPLKSQPNLAEAIDSQSLLPIVSALPFVNLQINVKTSFLQVTIKKIPTLEQ